MEDSLWANELPVRRRAQWVLDCEIHSRLAETGQIQLDDLYCRVYQFGQYQRPRMANWTSNARPVLEQDFVDPDPPFAPDD